ncbi:hypothetical protein K7X08_022194 [Anisodus acutangulus]|uniref:Uncharacterized protein n=1 Tax=Anisodus acutangulus TaxID=402998 RepID=A0A9Q1L768_9SOLA|nr:hypothetical protein K7X08_022194 [Anisodus acutangulus]
MASVARTEVPNNAEICEDFVASPSEVEDVNPSQSTEQQMLNKSVPQPDATIVANSGPSLCGATIAQTVTTISTEGRGKRIMPQEELILTPEMFPVLLTNGPLRIRRVERRNHKEGYQRSLY